MLVLRRNETTDVIGVRTVRMHASSEYVNEPLSLNTSGTRQTATYRPTAALHRSHPLPLDYTDRQTHTQTSV